MPTGEIQIMVETSTAIVDAAAPRTAALFFGTANFTAFYLTGAQVIEPQT